MVDQKLSMLFQEIVIVLCLNSGSWVQITKTSQNILLCYETWRKSQTWHWPTACKGRLDNQASWKLPAALDLYGATSECSKWSPFFHKLKPPGYFLEKVLNLSIFSHHGWLNRKRPFLAQFITTRDIRLLGWLNLSQQVRTWAVLLSDIRDMGVI